MVTDSELNAVVAAVLPGVVAVRRKIHAHPELSGEEFATGQLIREQLAGTAVRLHAPYLKTDVVGLLAGTAGDGDNVTLRADMDALPLQETSGAPYSSAIPGCAHSCGHDGHTAILLGTAQVLSRFTDRFAGSVRFIFQPGEEHTALAKPLLEAGAMDEPPAKCVFALHAHSTVPVGTVKTMAGLLMSELCDFKITLHGVSSIRSEVEKATDPLVGMAHLVTQLAGIVASRISCYDQVIIDYSRMEAFNPVGDVPAEAWLTGHIRALDPRNAETARQAIRRMADGVAASFGLTAECEFNTLYGSSRNSAECVELLHRITRETYGEEMFQTMPRPSMGTEDFCYYLKKAPGAFFNLGVGEDRPYCHDPRFDFNDDAIRYGITLMAKIALAALDSSFQPKP